MMMGPGIGEPGGFGRMCGPGAGGFMEWRIAGLEQALKLTDAQKQRLDAVKAACAAGLRVEVTVPRYRERTWRGYLADNPQVYRGWLTPEDHPAIRAAVEAYRAVVTPHVMEPAGGASAGARR